MLNQNTNIIIFPSKTYDARRKSGRDLDVWLIQNDQISMDDLQVCISSGVIDPGKKIVHKLLSSQVNAPFSFIFIQKLARLCENSRFLKQVLEYIREYLTETVETWREKHIDHLWHALQDLVHDHQLWDKVCGHLNEVEADETNELDGMDSLSITN
jgi:hypothetical protein